MSFNTENSPVTATNNEFSQLNITRDKQSESTLSNTELHSISPQEKARIANEIFEGSDSDRVGGRSLAEISADPFYIEKFEK